MKKIYLKINGYTFQMIFESEIALENQLMYISEYINLENITLDIKQESFDVNFNYLETEKLYESLINSILNSSSRKRIETFENQTHEIARIDNKDVFWNEKNQYVVLKESEDSFVFVTANAERSCAYPLYIIYEILVRLEENKKGIFMHGTSLNYDKKGILLLNNKKKGKTTFLIKLLENPSVCKQFLSNDRTFIHDKNGIFGIHHFPIPVVINAGTIKNSNSLREYVQGKRIFKRDIFDLDDHKSSCSIANSELSFIFDSTTCIERTSLNQIIIPNLRLGETGVFDIYQNQDTKILGDTCFTPYDTESLRKAWLYAKKYTDQELIEMSSELLERIRLNVPIHIVNFSPDIPNEKIYNGLSKVLRR